jgi:ATP-dependent RNA helicase DeaD
MNNYEGIEPALAAALEKRGYSELTPVQTAMLDPALIDADALVSAQTGSGKTVAFGLALAPTLLAGRQRFDRPGSPFALVIAPTRELALQVQRELEWLYEKTGATVASCVGGMDIRTERRALERGAHIVVGTPGRLRDHISREVLDLSQIMAVVLDEADEMLDLGFREDLEFILEAAPEDRRTLMFSATVSKSIARLAESYQRNAIRISTQSEQKQHGDIEYRALVAAPNDRDHAIINVLRFYEAKNAIVFCNTRAAVNHLTARLNNRGFTVVALSGELSQSERTHALQAMRDGRARVCIATDVAARGIDLPNLELVIHADLPTNPETLLHRSGRTGRAGRKGVSALIVPTSQKRKAERILQAGSLNAEWASPPSADDVNLRDNERLMQHEAFSASVEEDEADLVARLIDTHGAEKIAAAFVRQYRLGHSAPEDLSDVSYVLNGPKARPERAPRTESSRDHNEDFGRSVWVSLSVGRKQNAEPRWLIPVLCRSGNITKSAIGQIKMMQEETFVQLTEDGAETFLMTIGPQRTLDRGMRVTLLDQAPDFSSAGRSAAPRFSDKPQFQDRKRSNDRPSRDFQDRPPREKSDFKKKFNEPASDFGAAAPKKKSRKADYAAAAGSYDQPSRDRFADKPPRDQAPRDKGKPAGKSWGKPGRPDQPTGSDRPRKKKTGKPNG